MFWNVLQVLGLGDTEVRRLLGIFLFQRWWALSKLFVNAVGTDLETVRRKRIFNYIVTPHDLEL